MASPPPFVLTFAASDPTGGAGLQADLLTLAGMGCHPLSVVTALTVQDTHGVEDLLPVQAEWVSEQARHVLQDISVAAFKLGVPPSPPHPPAAPGPPRRGPRRGARRPARERADSGGAARAHRAAGHRRHAEQPRGAAP